MPPKGAAPNLHGSITLLLGGARSGKSSYAERLATMRAGGEPVLYVATATADDDEMNARIVAHRATRPPSWQTLEAPFAPAAALAAMPVSPRVVLLDCVTLLISNILLKHEPGEAPSVAASAEAERAATGEIEALLAWQRSSTASLILVSNEVGMGIVPAYPLGRAYRDLLGRINTRLAREADEVLLMIAGLPVELKALAAAWQAQIERPSL